MRIILFILMVMTISEAQERRYYIQFGSFHQLSTLEKSINRMPQKLRSHVVVIESNGWFIPFAYHTTKRVALSRKLPAYRRYFPDAYINDSPYILTHPVVRNYTKSGKRYRRAVVHQQRVPVVQNVAISEEDSTVPSYIPLAKTFPIATTIPLAESTPVVIPKPTKKIKVVHKKYKYFNKKMLSGKHYYLAYKSTKSSPDLLVRVDFQNHKVIYQPIMGDMNMRDARYLVEDKKLYMFADSFSKDGAFSKIDGHKKDYILVSSWYKGKKLNTLRYYYRLNDAKKYLGEKGSGKLATALQEGVFDGVELPNY